MKKVLIAAVIGGLLAGCSLFPGTAPTATSDPYTYVADLGFAGGKTITVNLYSGKGGQYSVQDVSSAWAVTDIFSYDITLSDVTDANNIKALTTFTVVCSSGHARAVFDHLKPGRKYQVSVVARGNHGGTAGDVVLNSGTPAIGVFDLTDTTVTTTTLTAAIQVKLDGGGQDTSGAIDLIPVAGTGGGSNLPETGHGTCLDPCAQDQVILNGTTTYDSTSQAGTNGDPFNPDPYHNHWSNSANWSSWVQRDLGGDYWVSQITIGAAYTDLSMAPSSKVYVKVRLTDGTWVTADYLENQNLKGYVKTLPKALKCNAFRLEMYNQNGWFSAQAIGLVGRSANCDGPSDSPPPSGAPVPSPTATVCGTPTPAPSLAPTPAPTATACDCPVPTPKPSSTPHHYKVHDQDHWCHEGTDTDAGKTLHDHFSDCFPGGLKIGKDQRCVKLNSIDDVCKFMPASGTADRFKHDGELDGPYNTGAGELAGNLCALKLNLAMSDHGYCGDPSMPLRKAKIVSGPCAGHQVGDLEDIGDRCVSGDYSALPSGCSVQQLSDAIKSCNTETDGRLGGVLRCGDCD